MSEAEIVQAKAVNRATARVALKKLMIAIVLIGPCMGGPICFSKLTALDSCAGVRLNSSKKVEKTGEFLIVRGGACSLSSGRRCADITDFAVTGGR